MLRKQSLLPTGSRFEGLLVENEASSQKGTFEVYKVCNLKLNRIETLKLDRNASKRLKNESEIYNQIKEFDFFPKVFSQSFENSLDYIVLEGYSSTLDYLISEHKSFDLGTTVSVYNQLINAIEILHKKFIIHGNISPKSVLINLTKTKILLSGFTESIDLKNTSTYVLKARNKNDLSCSFASLNTHTGNYSFKDDLESLGYLLVYMHLGKLPWKKFFPKNTFSKWQKVYIMKKTHSPEQLCNACPKEFCMFFNYLAGLQDKDPIDYAELKNLVSGLVEPDLIGSFLWAKKHKSRSKSFKKSGVARMKSQKTGNIDRNSHAKRSKSTVTRANLRPPTMNQESEEVKKGKTLDIDTSDKGMKSIDYEETLEDNDLPAFKDRRSLMKSKELLVLKFKKENNLTVSGFKTCVLV